MNVIKIQIFDYPNMVVLFPVNYEQHQIVAFQNKSHFFSKSAC